MAGANVPDAGEVVSCPSCGQEVKQKAMIPVLRSGERGYLCKDCARALIPAGAPPDPAPVVPSQPAVG